jgi:hypothetical protein
MSLTARIYFVYGMVSRQPDSNLKFLHICTSCPTGHVYGPGRVHRPCRAQVVAQCVIGPCHLSGIPLQKGFFPLSQRDFYFINCC